VTRKMDLKLQAAQVPSWIKADSQEAAE